MTIQDAPRQPSPGAQLGWAVLSTLLLAGWLAFQMGWMWALGGVIGVFVHEYGHILAINALGCGPGRLHIIPFLGGAASMKTQPKTEFAGVLIALAGPVAGLTAAFPFFLAAHYTGDPRWLGGAMFIGLINLVNLAPAPPLDGSKALGPVLARIHPWLERGAIVLIGLAAVAWAASTSNWLFGAFVAISVLATVRGRRLRAPAAPLTAGQWLASLGLYAAAIVLCAMVVRAADPLGLGPFGLIQHLGS